MIRHQTLTRYLTTLRRTARSSPGPLCAILLATVLGACSFNLDMLPGSSAKETAASTASPSVSALTAALVTNPNDPDIYYQRGLIYQSEQKHEHAIADFSSAIGLSARQSGALAGRAASYLATDKPQDAAADLDEAVRLEPNNPEIWSLRAQAYEKLGDNVKAAGSYQRVLALAPGDERAQAGFLRVGGKPGQTYEPF